MKISSTKKNYRLDSHKLIYHPQRVSEWLEKGDTYPLEVEISPSSMCNHRCIFCALDYLGHEKNLLDKNVIIRTIDELQAKGLKSVVCAGEGEPLLNPDMPDIAVALKNIGVDVAMSTNGALFAQDKIRHCLSAFTWVRFSIASFDVNAYQKIHRCSPHDLAKVKNNLAYAIEVKRNLGLKTTIGVQTLLLPANEKRIVDMAKELRDIGVDYFTLKPYMVHGFMHDIIAVNYAPPDGLEEELAQLETVAFRIYFRTGAMAKLNQQKPYDRCHALPFMVYISGDGNVWPCVEHVQREGFCYGNINESSFAAIWEGEQRQQVLKQMERMNMQQLCSASCRMDEMNRYLWELKHPGEHVNFI